MLRSLKEKRLIVPTVMTMVALPLLLLLGSWQMARKEWKENILNALAERASETPVPYPEMRNLLCRPSDEVGVLQSCDYRRVKIRGVFEHAREKHIFAGAQKTSEGPMPGYWVFTPFSPAQSVVGTASKGDHQPILVNRGFVPEALKSPERRAQGQVAGEVEILAHIRTRERRGWVDAPNDAGKNVYFVRDPLELGAAAADQVSPSGLLGSSTFYLELVGEAPEGGFPLPLAGHVELPNRHLEYALTWFGLAGALVAVYLVYAIPRLRTVNRP
jgi:surfeit locus 1 family protein